MHTIPFLKFFKNHLVFFVQNRRNYRSIIGVIVGWGKGSESRNMLVLV